jgi:hypothetical protein
MLTRESLIEWAASWVPETLPDGQPQRERFKAALADELKEWMEPPKKPVYCKHCPFAEFLHDGKGTPPRTIAGTRHWTPGCPGFEADPSRT